MQIQDLSTAKPVIQNHFSKYPKASISAMFRELRQKQYLSFIGDYPILASIICTVAHYGIDVKESAVKRAMRNSDELSGQKLLLNQLLEGQITIRNNAKIACKALKNKNLILTSSQTKEV